MTAKEVCDLVMKHGKNISDDEWIEISGWIHEFLRSDPPPEEKKIFVPLGCAEMVAMICDGIKRWRGSVCSDCKKQQGYEKYCCSVYQKNEKQLGGIPHEIWANADAECLYFQAK